MPLYKSAQVLEADDIKGFGDDDEVVLYEERPSKEDVIEMHQPDELQISFKLPPIPGSDAEMPIEVSSDDIAVENKGKKDDNDVQGAPLEVADPWKAPEPKYVLQWVYDRLNNLPRHSGRETTGMERTISVLKKINNEISRAIANDYKGEVDVGRLEQARKEIIDGIHRLEDAIDNLEEQNYTRKKKAVENPELVKEGQKATHVGGIIVTVPLRISAIARACINSMVSSGKDIERTADYFITKFKLSDLEQMELFQLFADMGYTVRRPRGLSTDEKFDSTSPDNVDFMQNFPG